MANCNYIIKRPGGGEIIIPADFGLLVNNKALQKIYEDTSENNTYELLEHIKDSVGSSISDIVISNIITENLGSLENIVEAVNEIIPQSSEYTNFEKALYKYLLVNKDNDPNQVSDLYQTLNAPLKMEYYNGVSGILNQTSMLEVHTKLQADMLEMKSFGIYTDVLKEMNVFLEAFKMKDKDLYRSNALLANQSILGIFSTNVENYTIYNENDITSLFMGLFKRSGIELGQQVLEAEFGNAEYFTSKTHEGNIQLTEFENDLLSKDPESRKRVEKAIDLISASLSESPLLANSIYNLFDYLNPEIELDNQNKKIIKTTEFMNSERTFESSFQADSYNRMLEVVNKDLDSNYGSELTHWKNTYVFMEDNLTIGQDLVFFPEIGEYALLTEYHNQGNGRIYIRGMQREGRNNKYVSQILSNQNPLKYRIKETSADPYVKGEKIEIGKNLTEVSSVTGFPESLLKSILRKGDIIMGTHVVGGIYPTYIMAGNMQTGKVEKVLYQDIQSFSSKIASTTVESSEWANMNHLETIVDMSTLSLGDKVKDPLDNDRIKTVLHADESFVYVERYGKILAINKNKIEGARLDTVADLDRTDINKVKAEFNNSLSGISKFSRFTDPSMVSSGDYFITNDGSVGKITDKNSGKSVVVDSDGFKLVTIHTSKNVEMYFTEKPLITKYTPTSLRVNNSLVHTSISEVDNPSNYEKAIYVVPKRATQKSMYLFPNNYANIGEWIPSKNFKPTTQKDVTHHVIKLISERDGTNPSDIDPYLEKDGTDSYKKDMTGLEEIKGFAKLSPEIKSILTPLRKGVQFRLQDQGSVSNSIYTITKVSDNTVTAEVSKTNSNGEIVTEQKTIEKETLLDTKMPNEPLAPHNSIANLYLRVGDSENIVLAQAIEEDLEVSAIQEKNAINELKKEMAETFKKINIQVAEGTEGFQAGQKAKITTNKESGLTQIVLNTSEGNYSDLVHENLHIQLILLRYNNLEEYQKLINKLSQDNPKFTERYGDDADLSTKEEFVVDELVRLSEGENNFLYDDLVSFMTAVSKIMEKHFGEVYKFDIAKSVTNPIEFLNTKMREFYNINKSDSKHPLYNMGIIASEPFLREWMQRENIKIIC